MKYFVKNGDAFGISKNFAVSSALPYAGTFGGDYYIFN
jgi:hypothetical protein